MQGGAEDAERLGVVCRGRGCTAAALQVRCRRYTFTDRRYLVLQGVRDWYSVCTLIPVAVGEHVVSDGQLLWSQQGLCITLILHCWQCLTFMLNASPFVPTSHVMLTSAEKML